MNTAERIRQARLQAGMTQEQLARAVGVSSITISRWERAKHEPLGHWFTRIAEATGVSAAELRSGGGGTA